MLPFTVVSVEHIFPLLFPILTISCSLLCRQKSQVSDLSSFLNYCPFDFWWIILELSEHITNYYEDLYNLYKVGKFENTESDEVSPVICCEFFRKYWQMVSSNINHIHELVYQCVILISCMRNCIMRWIGLWPGSF